jgi:hypothetical protein
VNRLTAQLAKVRQSSDKLGELVDEWHRKFGQHSMSLTAYVTYKDGAGEDRFQCIQDGVSVDPSGALFLISKRDPTGRIIEGHIIAPGQWREVNLQSEVDSPQGMTPLPPIHN